jgi:hypothetical protein
LNPKRIAILVFVALVAFAVTGDLRGWFDTPMHLGNDDEQTQQDEIDRLAIKARQSCRFGAALVRAEVRERRPVRTLRMADAYVDAIPGLDRKQREIVRRACLRGLELRFQ